MMLLQHAAGGPPDIGAMVLHHTADAWQVDLYPVGTIQLPRWADIHLGPLTLNLSPTKHVVYLILAAGLVFLSMWLAGRALTRQRAGERAPKGFAAAMEGFVLFVRNDIAIANIGRETGARYAPFVMTLFFLVLYCNLLGLVPWGATPTGNLAVTGALAILTFLAIEVGGFIQLGPKGYFHTIFPKVEGLGGAGAVAMSIGMAPIEVLSKLVKPFALAVRLFGNMTAGHFAILAMFGIIFLFGNLQGWNYAIGVATAAVVVGLMMLEIIVAFLQAYVFALLSAVFIGLMQHEH
ncbi:MAG TPA: F0F1 ATP synthase subunit A [Gemmatimonadales bacterium]|nr:F0F1 ATP synthase subunit A [Gemmatimonadales bacterium]